MILRVLTAVAATVLCVASSWAMADDAPAKGVAGELKATPVGVDGKTLAKNSVSLWQQVPSDAADKRLA